MSGPLLSAEQIADRVGCSVRTVRRWISEGILASVKLGGLRRVPERALEDFIGIERMDWGALAQDDRIAAGDADSVADQGSDG